MSRSLQKSPKTISSKGSAFIKGNWVKRDTRTGVMIAPSPDGKDAKYVTLVSGKVHRNKPSFVD